MIRFCAAVSESTRMEEEAMKLTKTDVIVAICLALCIPFCNMCIMLLGINGENPALWYTFPGFFVALLYTIGKGRTLRDLFDVVVSGLVGILWAYLGAELIGILVPVMGAIPGVFVSVAVMVFIFGVLMGPLPTFFNNYGFMYYLVMALFVTQMPATWAVCELVVGAVYCVILFGSFKLFAKFSPIEFSMKRGEDLSQGE